MLYIIYIIHIQFIDISKDVDPYQVGWLRLLRLAGRLLHDQDLHNWDFVTACLHLSGFVLVCLGDCPTQLSFVHFAVCSCQLCFKTIPYWVIWKKHSRAICWICLACNCSSSQQGFNEIKASSKVFLTKCWLERQLGKKAPHTIHELASAQNFSDLLADQLSSYGGAQLTIQSCPYRPL